MGSNRFVEDLITAHVFLQKAADRQEKMVEWMAKRLYASAGCPFPAWEKCPEDRSFPCWKCWVQEAERESGHG